MQIGTSKLYNKRDEFNIEIVNFPFIDGDVPCFPSYGVYISHLICFARVCFNVDNFYNRKKNLLLSYQNKVISTINFVKLFFNFITDTQI